MNFTVEEENLCCAFDTSDRTTLTFDIRAAMPDFEDDDMCDIARTVITKLEAMSDEDFDALELTPDFDDPDDESEV